MYSSTVTLTQQEKVKPENEYEDRTEETGHKSENLATDIEVHRAKSEWQNMNENYEVQYEEEPKTISHSEKSPTIINSIKQNEFQQSQEKHQAGVKIHVHECELKQPENCVEKPENQVERVKELKEKEQHYDQELVQEKISEFHTEHQEELDKLQQDLNKSKKAEEEYKRQLIEAQNETKSCKDREFQEVEKHKKLQSAQEELISSKDKELQELQQELEKYKRKFKEAEDELKICRDAYVYYIIQYVCISHWMYDKCCSVFIICLAVKYLSYLHVLCCMCDKRYGWL